MEPHSLIDLRSDTVTKPCDRMLKAMTLADVGDDVFSEDPTISRLEASLAERAGQEAGLFCPSGTQSNLVALLAHCQRGDEYIVGQNAHTYKYEAGGAAVLGSIQPQPLEHDDNGTIPLSKIRASIKADDFHFAKTRLLALENTIGGKVVSSDYLASARELATECGLSFHLDGARVFNAVVDQGVELATVTKPFDSVSICLSKGLGAPVGSVLVANKELIDSARRWRKMLGGGMRQAGILAAAGLYALEHNVEGLARDHSLAHELATSLSDVEGLEVMGGSAHTNMVYLSVADRFAEGFINACAAQGVLFTGSGQYRLVIHRDIHPEMISRAASVIKNVMANLV